MSKITIRRHLRKEYSSLMHDAAIKDGIGDDTTPATVEIVDRAEKLYIDVDHPREARLDSKLLSRIAQIGNKQVSHLNTSIVSFNEKEFCKLIKNKAEQKTWNLIHERIHNIIKSTFKLNLLTNDFQLKIPTRKRNDSKMERDESFVAKMPKLVENSQNNDVLTSKAVIEIYSSLCKQCNVSDDNFTMIPFYRFVSDPNSFSRTIQNIFHASFLNGNACMRETNQDLFICISFSFILVPSFKKSKNNSLENNQLIVSYSMNKWK
ncbi:hypothetical protein MXB_202, partial [Myxobolus squamalis]